MIIVKLHHSLFSNHQDIMYNINGDIVSGDHKILYKNLFIKVKEHPNSKKINFEDKYIYCLNTTNHKITTYNNIYTDYDEIINKKYYSDTLYKLNGEYYNDEIPLYQPWIPCPQY